MAHTYHPRRCAAKALTATVIAGLAVTGIAIPAHAQVNPGYNNEPRWAVRQDANWETMANQRVTEGFAMAGYGWRAGFRVKVGARWDSGTFYGSPWGNVEARAELWVDTPAGPATMRTAPTLVAVHTVPAFNGQWYAGCQGHTEGWNRLTAVAEARSWACSAPTEAGPGSNYQMGGYSICVVARGLAFVDQPSSWFTAVACTPPATRW